MKILMVCLGNICRSPLAKGILEKRFNELGIEAEVGSAGFESYHIGEKPDSRAIQIAAEHGIDISGHRARLFSKEDFDKYDKIYVMDPINYQDVMFFARNDSDKKKVEYLMNVLAPGSNQPVPDPYYGDINGFQKVYTLLEKACNKLADNLLKVKV